MRAVTRRSGVSSGPLEMLKDNDTKYRRKWESQEEVQATPARPGEAVVVAQTQERESDSESDAEEQE